MKTINIKLESDEIISTSLKEALAMQETPWTAIDIPEHTVLTKEEAIGLIYFCQCDDIYDHARYRAVRNILNHKHNTITIEDLNAIFFINGMYLSPISITVGKALSTIFQSVSKTINRFYLIEALLCVMSVLNKDEWKEFSATIPMELKEHCEHYYD